jgi:hypothetical protein
MTSRSIQAELDRQRAQMRQEIFQQRQQAAAEAVREQEDQRDAVTAKMMHLRQLRLAKESGKVVAVAEADGE